jgi:hypothetical protein
MQDEALGKIFTRPATQPTKSSTAKAPLLRRRHRPAAHVEAILRDQGTVLSVSSLMQITTASTAST